MATGGLLKGIQVHQSKFSVLAQPDSDSSDPDDVKEWKTANKKNKNKRQPVRNDKSQEEQTAISKAAVKNAKRRAKKKATANPLPNIATNHLKGDSDDWQRNDELSLEREFEKDLHEALLLSLQDEPQHNTMESTDVVDTSNTKSNVKKDVIKMSLQEFHKKDVQVMKETTQLEVTSHEASMTELLNSIDSQVKSEIKKGHQKKQVDKSSNIKQKQKVIDKGPHIFNKEESVVVAQLKDELEKKNDTIEKLKKNAAKMEAEMNEVKVRNQVLCKMMSSGEFATKFKLLEEIEELTADKVDLTSEIERLNSELEQERSKSKSLQVENIKLQKLKKNASIVT